MLKFLDKIKYLTIIFLCIISSSNVIYQAHADDGGYGLGVSPMNESIILNPGDNYKGSFTISNAASNTTSIAFEVVPTAFYVDENYESYYGIRDDSNQILDWITLDTPDGILAPNSSTSVFYEINVPQDAPAGGQYLSLMVSTKNQSDDNNDGSVGINIKQIMSISHIIYAEVTGETIKSGEISGSSLSSFLFSGKITGSSTVRNTGNVHGEAKYTLQVFPLFSNEEIYTNVEKPQTYTILPNRSRYVETTWEDTPSIGIFNVIYTVEFEGATQQISKMVIVCPIWLLFIIIFVIMAIIIFIVMKVKNRGKASKK